MNRVCGSMALIVAVCTFAGCASKPATTEAAKTVEGRPIAAANAKPAAPGMIAPISAAKPSTMLDAIKAMAGEWTTTDKDGKTVTAATYTVTANGSAVREVMFPGSPHEMTNMYHMDGSTLIMTHYCAMGNQPRMRAVAADGKTITLNPDSVTNLAKPDQVYMGGVTITFVDNDHVSFDWTSYKEGRADGSHNAPFKHTRKK